MNDWKRVVETKIINAHRIGWLGVCDAIVSAFTGQPRLIVATPVTISFYTKMGDNGTVALVSEVSCE